MSTSTSTPAVLIGDERITYRLAVDKARTAYRRKHGATVLQSLPERRAWTAAHADKMAASVDASGMRAVVRMHRARVAEAAAMEDPTRVGGLPPVDYMERIRGAAAHSTARLGVLAPPAKTRAVKESFSAPAPVELAPAPVVVEESFSAPVAAPATVPAPMPSMTRAARKATRREISATMRAEGLRPEGAEWVARCAAAGLPVDAIKREVSA